MLLFPAPPDAFRLRLRIARLRLRTAVTWWLLSLSVKLRSVFTRHGRSGIPLRQRLAPRPGQWHRPGTFTVFEWPHATVVDVQIMRSRIAVELQLEEGTITRVTGAGVWTRRAPRINVLRVLPLTDATYPTGEQLLLLPRRRASVRYVREQGHARRLPATPKVVEVLDAGFGATVALRTAPAGSSRHSH
jgi:hypothetical protein